MDSPISHPSRRLVLAATASLVAAPAFALKPVTSDEMAMGSPTAPLTLTEYASLACPHCARFHNGVFPAVKAKYIDTGQVRFVFKEMLIADANFAAAAGLVARAAGEEHYFEVVDAVFRDQEKIYQGGQLRGGLWPIAQAVGMTEAQFNACLQDREALMAIQTRYLRYRDVEGVRSTPTFEANRHRMNGEKTLADIDAFLAMAKAGPPPPPPPA